MVDEFSRTQGIDGGVDVFRVRPVRLRWSDEAGEHDVALERRAVVLGSRDDADVVVRHPTVSRRHCQLQWGDHGLAVGDLDSKNGTFVGGMRIERVWLQGSAALRLGAVEMALEMGPGGREVEVSRATRMGPLIGQSPQMREIFALIARVAPRDVTVLIEGESGTGKELVARALHERSGRRRGPFVVFDCSAVSAELIESELFGHVRGAFTGATRDRPGAFRQAHGGTLFIDEIGELSPALQPKLLRALEQRAVCPVGTNEYVPVDVRVVAATNRPLHTLVQQGAFREDLYFRLAVIRIELPPLRRRPEDIPLLVEHFLDEMCGKGPRPQVSWETMRKLQRQRWPGNVRELRNFVQRAVVLSSSGRLETRFARDGAPAAARPGPAGAAANVAVGDDGVARLEARFDLPFREAKESLVTAFERAYWERLLVASRGNVSEAARRGGIHRKSLEYLIRKLGLHVPRS